MNALEAATLELRALGHDEVIETADAHSRAYVGTRLEFPFASHLGMRRLWNFRGVHAPALERLLKGLEAPGMIGVEAWRGRLRRLLGDLDGARRDFEAARSGPDAALAAGWLGEMSWSREPREAAALIEEAVSPAWLAPLLWRAAGRLAAGDRKNAEAALADLDRYRDGGKLSPLEALLRAGVWLQAKDWARAHEEAVRAAALDPNNCAAYAVAGRALMGAGDTAGAVAAYNRARDRDPDLGTSHLLQGLGVRVDWEDPRAYLGALDSVIAKFPDLAPAYAERAELKRDPRLCEYEGALKDYERAAELDPGTAWIQAVLARAQNYHGGLRAGMPAFDRAVALAPEAGWIYAWRGEAWRGLREPTKAAADFERAAELMPAYSFTHAWRGALLRIEGKAAEADASLCIAVRLDPDYLFSWYERFQARRALKDWTGAVADLNHAYALDAKYSWFGRESRGAKPEDHVPRLAELDAAVAARPEDPWLRAWRGYSRLQLGEAPAALEDLRVAAAAAPGNAVVRGWTGWAQLQAGNVADARVELEASVALDPKQWFAWSQLADLHGAAGDLAAALGAMERVTELTPTSAAAHFRRASIAAALGRADAALESVHKALELDARYADAYLLLAQLQLSGGKTREASVSVDKALAISPEIIPEKERRALTELLRQA